MRPNLKYLFLFLICSSLVFSCVKEELNIDQNISIPGLDPSFAIPLAHTDIGLGQLVPALNLAENVYSESGQILAISFTQRLFEFGLKDLVSLPDQNVAETYHANAITAAIINSGLEGDQIPFSQPFNLPLDFSNGEDLDSLRFQEATLQIQVTSSFRHDITVNMAIPELTEQGIVFERSFALDYDGTLPTSGNFSFDISNTKLDFTAPGNNNALNILADFMITHSGEFTIPGDSLQFELSLSANSIHSAYGYLGQFSGIAEVDTQQVNIFEQFQADGLFFTEPAIELLISNSSGIPMEVDFISLYAPENSVTTLITGGALEDIPVVQAAAFIGDIAYTEHRIDNSNTSPQLSEMLNEGPVNLIYSAEGLTNPEGYSYNFIQDTSKITCDATLILPLFGYLDGYHFIDTLEVDMQTDLGLDTGGPISLDDVSRLTFRIIVDNGLPAEAKIQLVFMDADYNAVDSLFMSKAAQMVVASGYVNTSLPAGHLDYGRVLSRTRAITDIDVTVDRLQELIDGNVKHLVIRIVAGTSFASQEQVVRFFPEDGVEVQLSAKIETHIDLSE